jgi:hypothetical protein
VPNNAPRAMHSAIASEFVRDLILGMVAGLITTISMAINGGEQEGQGRLRALRGWMQRNNLPKSFALPMTEVWCSGSVVQLAVTGD